MKNDISAPAARLKKIRLYLGMTRQEFGEALGISQFTIRSWENGAKNFTESSARRIIKSLKEKLKFDCSFDWMMYGQGKSPISLYEEKDTVNDVTFDSSHEKFIKEVVAFKQWNKEVHIIAVTDMRFLPVAERGDYIGLLSIPSHALNTYLDNMVYLIDGRGLGKFGPLLREKKHYYIHCLAEERFYKIVTSKIKELYALVWFRKMYE